jgi:hypothetical protein
MVFRTLLSPLPGPWWIKTIVTVGFTHGYTLPPLPWLNRSRASFLMPH